MIILKDSRLCRFLMWLPLWSCRLESARVGQDYSSFVLVARPYWLR